MVSPGEYVKFAAWCVDLAQAEPTHQNQYLEMASAWVQLACDSLIELELAPKDPDLSLLDISRCLESPMSA